ncbi:MAG: hypothetical protein JJ920_13660 [Roseitalea sp.]|jgi:TRAP-type C4-dicarboxylate transport system substrate-binding protein|nr:hypothetical protein [Roseitalea sp.]MBO6720808.1 hypothetical protein [Roseitalea sp.]MBO6743955.1 hypothetical protein [Roseitalea sp.]
MKNWKLAFGLAATLSIASPASAETTIVFGSPAGPDAPEGLAVKAFAEKVGEATDGEVVFETSFSGSVVTWGTSLTGVRDNLVDATFLTPAFHPSELGATFVFIRLVTAPGELNARTAAAAETALLNCPQCQREWDRFNVRPLVVTGSDPFNMICKPEVTTLGAVEGKAIRAAGPFADYVKDMGGTPVSTVPTEVFEGMQRGQVDCAMGGVGWLRQFGLGDVAEYVLDETIGYDHARLPFSINADIWEGLDDDHRQAMIDNLGFLHAEANALNTSYGLDARQEAEAKGVQFVAMSDDLKAASDAHREAVFDAAAAAATEQGVEGAAELVASYRANLDKWNAIMAEIGDDRAAYEQALQREIYSKLN